MSVIKVCPTCGQEFQTKHTERQMYCSRSCAAKRGSTVSDEDTRICRNCGEPFHRPPETALGSWRLRVFCSEGCKIAWHRLASESVCQCGQPATTRVYFTNLTGDGRTQAGYLSVCQDCHDYMIETDPGCSATPQICPSHDHSPWFERPLAAGRYGEPTAHLTKGNRPR